MRALETVRDQGFAIDDCETRPTADASPFALRGMPFPCGISVSAPARRLTIDMVPSVVKRIRSVGKHLVSDFLNEG